jgi:primosomal protein N'
LFALDDRSPVEATKDIDQIVDPQPVLSSIQIDLAHWISDHYLAPIQHIVFGMLPPGITQNVDIIISLLPDAQPSNPTEAQAQFLALLQRKAPFIAPDRPPQQTPQLAGDYRAIGKSRLGCKRATNTAPLRYAQNL